MKNSSSSWLRATGRLGTAGLTLILPTAATTAVLVGTQAGPADAYSVVEHNSIYFKNISTKSPSNGWKEKFYVSEDSHRFGMSGYIRGDNSYYGVRLEYTSTEDIGGDILYSTEETFGPYSSYEDLASRTWFSNAKRLFSSNLLYATAGPVSWASSGVAIGGLYLHGGSDIEPPS